MDKEWLGKVKVSFYVLVCVLIVYLIGIAFSSGSLADSTSDNAQAVSSANIAPGMLPTAVFILDETDNQAHRNLAISYYEIGDYENAIWHYNYALALDPSNITYYLERGRVYAQAGLMPLAVNDFEHCLRLGASASAVALSYHDLAAVAYEQRRFVQSLGYLERAIALSPQDARLYHMQAVVYEAAGNWLGAVQSYEQVITMSPELGYDILIEWGDVARYTESHTQAVEQFTRAIQLMPNHTYAYLYRAVSYYALGYVDEAYADILQALEINPADPQVYEFLSWFYNNQGQAALADAYYQRSRELNP